MAVFYHAEIHTMKDGDPVFFAMEVKDGQVARLFSEEEFREKFREPGKDMTDLGGRHVYPCLIDPHVHLLYTIAVMAAGFSACRITEHGVEPRTLSEVGEKIQRFCESQKPGAVVAVNNYIRAAMAECRMPSREELDLWGGGRPVVLYNIDGHSTSLSTAMLEKIGIDPAGHSGVLTGEENERAQGKITDVVSASVSLSVLAKGIARFENYCAEHGICMVGALEGNGDSERDPATRLIAFLARHFDTEVRLYLQYQDLRRVEPYTRWMHHRRVGGCGDWEMDGSVGSHSAAFDVPYPGKDAPSPCYYSEEDISRLIRDADRKGYQISSHAIGETAIRRLENALSETAPGRLHRIEHCEFTDDETFQKISEGRFAVVVQPGYSYIDKRYLHTYEEALPGEILRRMKLRSYLRNGVILAGSSDSPVQDMDPFLQMAGMTSFYVEEESISAREALLCYTRNAALALEEEASYGTLEPGKTASFFTADRDFAALSTEEILSFLPAETYYKGKKYQKKSGTVPELLTMLLRPAKKI